MKSLFAETKILPGLFQRKTCKFMLTGATILFILLRCSGDAKMQQITMSLSKVVVTCSKLGTFPMINVLTLPSTVFSKHKT